MANIVRRIFVERKQDFNIEAQLLCDDIRDVLGVTGLKSIRIATRYDVEGLSKEEFEQAKNTVFSEQFTDKIYEEKMEIPVECKVLAIGYLPSQYDQKADTISKTIQMLTCGEKPLVNVAKIIIFEGKISDEEYKKIKSYLINPVESREVQLEKPETLRQKATPPKDVEVISGFISMSKEELENYMNEIGFSMSYRDMEFCQKYFRDIEKRNPTFTEMKLIDTYWSDHCRHTTFLTKINNVDFEEGYSSDVIKNAYKRYLESRKYVYEDKDRDICLMDIATIAMKEMRKNGTLKDLDVSDEINACSIVVKVRINGSIEEWLVMFKNETHNHPTEIEPFGGAATCLGGAIRDPLSGRSYVYQAMRITGSGDPTGKIEDTLPGKLPQRKITTTAAAGYSSYGNQIGVATGQVAEIYHEGYVAKRMELGAVMAAAPKKNVVREKPQPGDIIVLVGGRTGRDGCGGATGSSKAHTDESLMTSGAEVQKGNAAIERNIQRLFRKEEVSTLIKKCNDFGAGGVSVAIGELADGLEINLDAVPVKYDGLDGTEIAISESQERMAVVLAKENVQTFIDAADEENLEATPVAVVTDHNRLKMNWRGKTIVDISRDFLDTNGVKQCTEVKVKTPDNRTFFKKTSNEIKNLSNNIKNAWLNNLSRLNVCSQKGLVERFDSTIGAGTVLMPFGGKYQLTPAEGMVAKIPVVKSNTTTCTIMTYGFNPYLSEWSPFHGALYAVIEAVAKVTAIGGDYKRVRLTFQEYFERLGNDAAKWGKPFSALLGAFMAQKELGIPSIGGKDSMSGTFNDINVPPTLVAFAVDVTDITNIVSSEFKKTGSKVVLIPLNRDENEIPDFEQLRLNYSRVHELIKQNKILSSCTIKSGGIAEAISKMAFGNFIGFSFEENMDNNKLFSPDYGSLILELSADEDIETLLNGIEYFCLGYTQSREEITVNDTIIDLREAIEHWTKPLEKVFPTKTIYTDEKSDEKIKWSLTNDTYGLNRDLKAVNKGYRKLDSIVSKPRVFIPIFPGTNCEYDMIKAFEKTGALVNTQVFRNKSSIDIKESISEMKENINNSQIIILPGGISTGDELEGTGNFVATVFRNPYISEAIMNFLKLNDGLILGISDGFQALLKLGLLPYGEIRSKNDNNASLVGNSIGRHVSTMVRTKVVSVSSPWLSNMNIGDIHILPVSQGAGKFVASEELIKTMLKNGQIATQYVDFEDNPTNDIEFNPTGSIYAIEGITSVDGKIFGKIAHSERISSNVAINIPGEKNQKIFEAGVQYFK